MGDKFACDDQRGDEHPLCYPYGGPRSPDVLVDRLICDQELRSPRADDLEDTPNRGIHEFNITDDDRRNRLISLSDRPDSLGARWICPDVHRRDRESGPSKPSPQAHAERTAWPPEDGHALWFGCCTHTKGTRCPNQMLPTIQWRGCSEGAEEVRARPLAPSASDGDTLGTRISGPERVGAISQFGILGPPHQVGRDLDAPCTITAVSMVLPQTRRGRPAPRYAGFGEICQVNRHVTALWGSWGVAVWTLGQAIVVGSGRWSC